MPAAGGRVLSAALVLTLVAVTLHAQGRRTTAQRVALDRTKAPVPAPTPAVRVPTWTTSALSNGAELVVSRKRNLPLVSVSVNFVGGKYQFEDPSKRGVATLTAQMMSEGTTMRTGDQLADAQQMLGTQISVGISGESGSITFNALSSKLDAALEVLGDMLVSATFPADALERRRSQLLVGLTQAKVQPGTIGANVFARVLYGDDHPYGRVADEQSVKSITRDDVVNFAREYFRPARAIITVVGDVDPTSVRASVEKALAQWPAGGTKVAFAYPTLPAAGATTIYLVDKPKAPQSVFNIGLPGPSLDTPDHYAIQVMNTILGSLFQSRLNSLLREQKGYTYRATSSFAYGRGPGAFRAGGDIVTAKSDSALIDFMNELRGVRGSKPFTDDEIKQGKESLIQGLVHRFESVSATANAISSIYVQNLPESYFNDYSAKVSAVTADDLVRVAQKYIDLDHLNIVIVGDRATIEEPLRKAGIAPVVVLDIEGKPIPATP
jgi:predicted Zn-dependent peptidase